MLDTMYLLLFTVGLLLSLMLAQGLVEVFFWLHNKWRKW